MSSFVTLFIVTQVTQTAIPFVRDRVTLLMYLLLAVFAYLQAAPGLVVVHLRSELDLSYTVGGLHVAAFAAGSTVAGAVAARLEAALGRGVLLWSAAAVMAVGAVGLTVGPFAVATIGAALVMGAGAGLLLVTVQAVLADHHGAGRTVALAEANVAASLGYLGLVGTLSLSAALGLGWRTAVLAALAVPALAWWTNRRLDIDESDATDPVAGRLPSAFWIVAVVLFCCTAAEWVVGSWGASFVADAADLSSDTAVMLMTGYFAGVLAGRLVGSRLARHYLPHRLLAVALGIAAAGFAVLWPATTVAPLLVGLALLGVGLGNLFPMAVSVAVALAPDRASLASGRAVAASSLAIAIAPFGVGALADAATLHAAVAVMPVLLVLAATGLAAVRVHEVRA